MNKLSVLTVLLAVFLTHSEALNEIAENEADYSKFKNNLIFPFFITSNQLIEIMIF